MTSLKRSRSWRIAAAGSVVAGLAATAGLAGAGSAAGATKSVKTDHALTHITIGVSAAVAEQMMPFYAQQYGIFKKYGIDANVSLVSATSLVSGLASGTLNFAAMAAPQPEEAVAAGAPLQWVGIWSDHPDFRLLVAPGINSFSQIAGKTAGETAAGSTTGILLALVLEEHGINTGQVHWDNVGTPTNLSSSMADGEVAVALQGPPAYEVVEADRPGEHVLLNLQNNFPWPFAGLEVNASYGAKHAKLVENVLKALSVTLTDWKKNPAKAEAVIESVSTGTTASEAKISYQSSLKSLDSNLVPSATAEQAVLKTIRSSFPSLKGLQPAHFINTSYLKKAGLPS